MKSILICNQKGGVGKSLVADELAFSFERSGIPLAFFDVDQQGGVNHKTNRAENAEVMIADTPGALQSRIKDWMLESDIIVIPTRPTSRDIPPLLRMIDIVASTVSDKPVMYIINGCNRFRASLDFQDWFNSVIDGSNGTVLKLPQSELFVQAAAAGVSILQYAKKSAAATATLNMVNTIRIAAGFPAEL